MSNLRLETRAPARHRPSLLPAAATYLLLSLSLVAQAHGYRDADTLYIGDVGDDTVKTFDAKTGDFLGDFVTSGSGGLSGPMGLIFKGGKLLLANQNVDADNNGEVLRYDRGTGDFADALVAADAPNAPYAPRGILRAPFGNQLYVGDVGTQGDDCSNEGRIARYRLSNGKFLGDFDRDGFDAEFHPRGLVIGPDGLLYVSAIGCPIPPDPLFDPLAGYVLRFDPRTGKFVDVFASNATIPDLHRPEGLVFDERGNLWVTSFRADADDNDKILELSGPGQHKAGKLKRALPLADPANAGGLRAYAQAILFGPRGDLYIPIAGGDATTAGQVRRCDTRHLSCKVIVPADGTLFAPYYLSFEHTDPSTLEYDD